MRKVYKVKVDSIALCKDAKNKRKVFLLKSKNGGSMNREDALKLLDAENITDEQKKIILEGLPEDIKKEVDIYLQAQKDFEDKDKDKKKDKDNPDKDDTDKDDKDKKDKDGKDKDDDTDKDKDKPDKDNPDDSKDKDKDKDDTDKDKDDKGDISDEDFNEMLNTEMKKEGLTEDKLVEQETG